MKQLFTNTVMGAFGEVEKKHIFTSYKNYNVLPSNSNSNFVGTIEKSNHLINGANGFFTTLPKNCPHKVRNHVRIRLIVISFNKIIISSPHRHELNKYMHLLVRNYNISTMDRLMCRNTLSVNWDGKLYDCDFNQQLMMAMTKEGKYN